MSCVKPIEVCRESLKERSQACHNQSSASDICGAANVPDLQPSINTTLQETRLSQESSLSGSSASALVQEALSYNGSNGVHDAIYNLNNKDLIAHISGIAESEMQEDLKRKDQSGKTKLHHAAIVDDLRLLDLMIKKCSIENLFVQDIEGKTFFHYLMIYAQCPTNVQGEEVNVSVIQNNLHIIFNKIIQRFGISSFEKFVNIQDNDGKTALFYAAKYNENNWPFIDILFLIPPNNRVPLLLAKINSEDTLLHYLARRDDSNLLIQTLKLLQLNEVEYLLMAPNLAGPTRGGGGVLRAASAAAAASGALASKEVGETVFDILLQMGVEKHDFNIEKKEEIFWTVPEGRFAVIIQILRLFLEEKKVCLLSRLDESNKTLLHKVAESNDPKILSDLLALIDPQNRAICLNIVDARGDTALHYVSRRGDPKVRNYQEVVKKVISMIPENQRFSILEKRNALGHDVLFLLLNSEDSAIILEILKLLNSGERGLVLARLNS